MQGHYQRHPSLQHYPIGQIVVAFRLLVQALQPVQRYRELSSVVLNRLSQALQLSYGALLIRDSISVDIGSYSAYPFTAQVLAQFAKRIQGSTNSVQEEDFKGNRQEFNEDYPSFFAVIVANNRVRVLSNNGYCL